MADKKQVKMPKTTDGGDVPRQNKEEKRVSKDSGGTGPAAASNEQSQQKSSQNGGGGVVVDFPQLSRVPTLGPRTWGKWAPPPPEESIHESIVEKPKPKESPKPPTPPPRKSEPPHEIQQEPPKKAKHKESPKREKALKEHEHKSKQKEFPKPNLGEIQEEPIQQLQPKEQAESPQKPADKKPAATKEMTPPSPPPQTPTPIPKRIEVQQDPVQIPKELPLPTKPEPKEPVQKQTPTEPPPEAPKLELEKILEKPAKPITYELPYNLDVASIVPTHLVKSIKIKKIKKTAAIRQHVAPPAENDKPPGPIASRVVFLKKPDEPQKAPEEPPAEPAPVIAPIKTPAAPPIKTPEPAPIGVIQPQGPADINGLPMFLVTDTVANLIKITDEDKLIDKRLSELIDVHRGDILKKLKKKKQTKIPTYTYADMMKMLKEQGIPCPTNDDFSRLHGLHSRWDPDFTVLEYFSPMLRTFIPINMRGRYRGCWTTDDCIKGLDISKVAPKREALEGFVQRGRHENTQKKYDEMSAVALDEAHLDYLIEIQSYQAETIPIPIFYDMLHLGMEVANENLRMEEDGYPPNDVIFMSTEQHAQQLKRKIQLYGALGLETLESKRKGLGQYSPQWLKSRDEVIREIMNRKDNEWYSRLTNMEDEGKVREKARKQRPDGNQQQQESKSKARTSLKLRASFLGKDARKVYPESRTQQKTGGEEGGDGKNEGKKGLLKSQK